jgi:hypothetical protein
MSGHVTLFMAPGSNLLITEREAMGTPAQHGEKVAVEIARRFIDKLEYCQKDLYVNLEPDVRSLNRRIGTYRVTWNKPHNAQSSVELRISIFDHTVKSVSFTNFRLNRPFPIEIPPQFLPRRKSPLGEPVGQYEAELLNRYYPLIIEFISKLKLPIALHGRSSISLIERFEIDGMPNGTILTTNDYRFSFSAKGVNGFAAPDLFFKLAEEVELDKFYGTQKYSERNGARIIKEEIQKLGISPKSVGLSTKPDVIRPRIKGPRQVPRRKFLWLEPIPGAHRLMTVAEIDLETGAIKLLWMPSLQ